MRSLHLALSFALPFALLACNSFDPSNDATHASDVEDSVDSASFALTGVTFASLRSGNWTDSTMWNPSGVPAAQDAVNIGSAHQVTVDAATTVASVNLVETSGSMLIMNDDLTVESSLTAGKYCNVDLNDNTLQASNVSLRQSAAILRDAGGRLDVTNTLSTYWSAYLALQPNDTLGSLHLQRSSGSTTATSNIANNVTLVRDGVTATLHLGAPLALTGAISATESAIEDGGNDIDAASIYLYSSGLVRQGTGTIDISGNVTVTRNTVFDARSGDVVRGNLIGTGPGTLTRADIAVNQLAGDSTGLTVDGNVSLNATYDKSILTLNFDNNLGEGFDWALAWKGDHVAQLLNWLTPSIGQLVVNFPAGIPFDPAEHIFYDSDTGYTYVGYTHYLCGNGIVNGTEQCDDGNTDETDGCLSTCEFPPLPVVVGQWTFEGANPLAESTGNWSALTLQGNATVTNGALHLHGSGTTASGWAKSSTYTGPIVREKTLVSWVTLDNLNVRGGSALSLIGKAKNEFDAIVYAERQPLRWMAGSDFYKRTQDVVAQDETVVGQPIQMAVSYRDMGGNNVQVTICRNGVQIGQYSSGTMMQWSAGDSEVIFGARHIYQGAPRGAIEGRIGEARIYAGAMSCAQIGTLN